MRASVHVVRVAAGLLLRVSPEVLSRRSAVSPAAVGRQLARQADTYVREQGLGYYPPLDYLLSQAAVDEELAETARSVAWLAGQIAQDTVRRRLRAVFSQVELDSMQSLAYTMPSVRPSDKESVEALARHFTPDTVKLALTLSFLQRRPAREVSQQYARRMLWRWLKDHFSRMEVTNARLASD